LIKAISHFQFFDAQSFAYVGWFSPGGKGLYEKPPPYLRAAALEKLLWIVSVKERVASSLLF